MSWFNQIAKTCQMPLMLDQFGEKVYISLGGEFEIHQDAWNGISAVVKIDTQEGANQNGQAMIERAEVLLPVDESRYQNGHFADIVKKLTTAHVLKIRGQIFSIEAIGTENGGYRKLICKARKPETTNRSLLNGRL